MHYWNPMNQTTETWHPRAGWNATFSESEKLQITNLFFFFKNKKGLNEQVADILAQMVLYKQKHHGLQYSEEQEAQIQEALRPIFNS